MKAKGAIESDSLLSAFLIAAVVVVLLGWVTALVYTGFRYL